MDFVFADFTQCTFEYEEKKKDEWKRKDLVKWILHFEVGSSEQALSQKKLEKKKKKWQSLRYLLSMYHHIIFKQHI